MLQRTAILVGITLILTCGQLAAAPIFTIGAGSAVTSPDRIATFDSVVTYTDLTSYVEGGLSITVPNFAYIGFTPGLGFSGGFHYPSGGVSAATVISPTDSAIMYAAEFTAGDGWSIDSPLYFAWETRLGGTTTGGGYYTADKSQPIILGIADLAGFDTLLVAAYDDLSKAMAGLDPTGYQALALDNLSVQTGPGAAIPEPATVALTGLGIFVFGLIRRRF